jgi:hypothetical protein
MGYMLNGLGSIPGRGRDFSLLYSVHAVSTAHSASHKAGTREYADRE